MTLSRCTILGEIAVHRLQASECILQMLAAVDDTQDGCIRFTAWADGSVLPRKFESVRIPQGAPLFTSTDFGQPGYARLAEGAPAALRQGAADASEIGAFSALQESRRRAQLHAALDEHLPASLTADIHFID